MPVFVYVGPDFNLFREVFSEIGTVLKDSTDRAWEKRWSARPFRPRVGGAEQRAACYTP